MPYWHSHTVESTHNCPDSKQNTSVRPSENYVWRVDLQPWECAAEVWERIWVRPIRVHILERQVLCVAHTQLLKKQNLYWTFFLLSVHKINLFLNWITCCLYHSHIHLITDVRVVETFQYSVFQLMIISNIFFVENTN